MRIDRRWAIAGLLLVVASVMLSACQERQPQRKPAPSGATLDEPGLYRLPDDRTLALGTLQYRAIEGGFWAVVDSMPEQATPQTKVLAVLVDAESLGVDLGAAEGGYVAVEGRLRDGVSTRIAGPEMDAETLKLLSGGRSESETDGVEPTTTPSPTTPR